MPHLPRYLIIDNNSLFHVTWKCHNNDWLLSENWAKQFYYDLLLKHKEKYKVSIYAYCFMSNHPHLVGHCVDKKLFSDFFRIVNSSFAKYYNKRMDRRGQVVMDRFKSPRIDSESYLVNVIPYVELNPVRASMIKHPKDFRWSSFNYYAYGTPDPLITPAPCYLWLGNTNEERQKEYRKYVERILKYDVLIKKKYSTINYIGNPYWILEQERKLKEFIKLKKELKKNTDPPDNTVLISE